MLEHARQGRSLFALVMVFALGCSRPGDGAPPPPPPSAPPAPDDGVVSEYLGYAAINTTLRTRLMRAGTHFELSSYLTPPEGAASDTTLGGAQPPSLVDLLGSYDAKGLRETRENGIPNAFNVVLWNVILSAFATDLGAVCNADTAPLVAELDGAVLADVRALCTWPSPDATSPESMRRFFSDVMAFDAPPEELDAFRALFSGPDFADMQGSDVVTAMTRAIVLNPHFLLRK
jgi:hypothetical protein